jgi:hypothetical protein
MAFMYKLIGWTRSPATPQGERAPSQNLIYFYSALLQNVNADIGRPGTIPGNARQGS